jgi:peptidoglycan hydrolase CwlO-like protein
MTTDYMGNGQSDEKHDDNPDSKPDETPDEPKTLTLAERKKAWAREAQETRTGLLADIDQLLAEINAIESTANVQVAEIEAEIKQLRAEIRNIDKIHGNAEKVVTVPGPAATAPPVVAKKAKK